jgi:hypothetical protein
MVLVEKSKKLVEICTLPVHPQSPNISVLPIDYLAARTHIDDVSKSFGSLTTE